MAGKPRIVYLLREFPQISQTYIKYEIEALTPQFDVHVIAEYEPNIPYRTNFKALYTQRVEEAAAQVRALRPLALHGHWLEDVPMLHAVAKATGVPFTVRTHSFDILHHPAPLRHANWKRLRAWLSGKPDPTLPYPQRFMHMLKSEYCLGVLGFPFGRTILEAAGLPPERWIDCFPVMAFDRFHDESANGQDVMNTGACIPKKRMQDFIDLAGLVPERKFRLYPMGYQVATIDAYNQQAGQPVEMMTPVEPDDMPAQYKRHQWLVYTADRKLNGVGWPVAIAEAQAAGVGVCVPNIRPDIAEYVGGAGYVYDSIEEVAKIIRQPLPDEIRMRGFEMARRSDIKQHLPLLTSLWPHP